MNFVPGKVYFVGSIPPDCILVLVGTFSRVIFDERKARECEKAELLRN